MAYKILIVDDEDGIREMLQRAMLTWSLEADYAPGPKEALSLMKMKNYDIVITDKNMPGKDGVAEAGMHVLKQAKKILPSAEVIMMTGYASIETVMEAMRNGAFDYIRKPFQIEELKEIIDRIIDYKKFSNSANAIGLYREIFNEILNLVQNNYKSDDKELHSKLKSILNKFYTFFKIQKENEKAFKNIYTNVEKLKESIVRTDPNYQLLLNISQVINNQMKKN
jgi:DNA-binding NtrC family response regulator